MGGILAIVGVIICPISSGDTAFRSARLIIAEMFKLDQKPMKNRLIITIPLLAIGALLVWFSISNQDGFQIIWRYMSWSNQTLAMITLWVVTIYYIKKGKYRFGSLLTALPATFMSAVTMTYLLTAKEGFELDYTASWIVGLVFALTLLGLYGWFLIKKSLGNENSNTRFPTFC